MLAFRDTAIENGLFLGKWLAFAFFLESLMLAYVSPDWIGGYVGADNLFAIPLAAIVGVPSYLNGYAAIPLISGLLEMGMTPGVEFAVIGAAPLGDPIELEVRGYRLSVRKSEAARVEVEAAT